jgi:hypothetical protein
MFLNSIAAIKEWTDGITEGVSFDEIKGTVRSIERDYLQTLFSKELLTRLEGNDSAMNDSEKYVRDLILEAVANLTVWKYSFSAPLQLTGSGLHHIETENFRPGYKYEKEDFRGVKEATGLACLEMALYEAVSKKSEMVTSWATSLHYKAATSRLINFTKDFQEGQYRIGRKTLETMLRFITLVERQVVIPLLGETLYNELKNNQYTEGYLTDEDNPKKVILLNLLREAVSQYAILLAMKVNLVSLEGAQVLTNEWTNDDAKNQQKIPEENILQIALLTRKDYAKMYFLEVKKYLTDNATDLGWVIPVASEVTTTTQTGIKTLR